MHACFCSDRTLIRPIARLIDELKYFVGTTLNLCWFMHSTVLECSQVLASILPLTVGGRVRRYPPCTQMYGASVPALLVQQINESRLEQVVGGSRAGDGV